MMRYTRETICSVLFGQQLSAAQRELGEAVTTVFGQLRSEILYLPLWRLLPTGRSRKWNRAVRLLNRTFQDILRARRESAVEHGDLLEALMRARDPEGEAMPDQQIHDEILTFFLAGHETAALSLTWACYLLAHHPEMQEQVRDEVRSVLVERELTPVAYPKLTFTPAVVKEALRLYPPIWSMGREAIVNITLDGQPVPKGTSIWICLYRTHRDPRWYPEPDRFLPDRWLRAPAPRPFAYLPFGIGPRVCIGQHFAMMEAVIGLAAILSRFRLQPRDPLSIEPSAWITLRPKQRLLPQAAAWR